MVCNVKYLKISLSEKQIRSFLNKNLFDFLQKVLKRNKINHQFTIINQFDYGDR